MTVLNKFNDIATNKDSYFLNHLENKTISPKKEMGTVTYRTCEGKKLIPAEGKVLHYATNAFPIITLFNQPVGLFLRSVTDLSLLRTSGLKMFPVMKTTLSWMSFLSTFSSYPFAKIEIYRLMIMNCEGLYTSYCNAGNKTDEWKLKVGQQTLNLVVDITNAAVSLPVLNRYSLELKTLSLTLQVAGSGLDIWKERKEGSYFSLIMQSLLAVIRLSSLNASAQNLRASWTPKEKINQELIQKSLGEVIQPQRTSTSLIQTLDTSRLYQPGTGSSELSKFQLIKNLGFDGISSEQFLVKDENGKTLLLTRLLSEIEKMEHSKGYSILQLVFWPLTLLAELINIRKVNCDKALEISKNVDDSHLVKAYKMIKNNYSKIDEKTGGNRSIFDMYLVTDYFEGTSVEKLGKSKDFFGYMQSISNTLLNISGLDYFYDSSFAMDIKVNAESNELKFTSPSSFTHIVSSSNSWKQCVSVYESLNKFFVNLVKRSSLPNKDDLLAKLNEIFSQQNLIEQYNKAAEKTEEMQKTISEIFTKELLKEVLTQLRDLFTPSSAE